VDRRRIEGWAGADPEWIRIAARGVMMAVASAVASGVGTGIWLHTSLL
jgi:hypothetical protein